MSTQFNAITENGQCALLLQKEQRSVRTSRALPTGDAFGSSAFRFWNELFGGLAGSSDLCLEDDMTFAGSEGFRSCACADFFRPFGVLVVSVLI
jgi:hypothetical protein